MIKFNKSDFAEFFESALVTYAEMVDESENVNMRTHEAYKSSVSQFPKKQLSNSYESQTNFSARQAG